MERCKAKELILNWNKTKIQKGKAHTCGSKEFAQIQIIILKKADSINNRYQKR